MNNLHPRVFERFLSQLPEGSSIVTVRSDNLLQSKMTAVINGVTDDTITLPKTSLQAFLKRAELELLVNDGDTVSQVLQQFSEKHDLFWVEGVDYKADDGVVIFDETHRVRYQLIVPEDSIIWTGEVVLWLYNKAEHGRPVEPIKVPLDGPRLQIALSGHVFQGDGEVFTAGRKAVTPKFAKKVIGYLKSVGVSTLTATDLTKGNIIDAVTDGFSGMIVMKPKRGPHLFIRFRSEGEDLHTPSPGDVDPE